MKNKLLILFSLVVLIISTIALVNMVADSFEIYLKEGKCATELVSLGIERSDIETFNGTCRVKRL